MSALPLLLHSPICLSRPQVLPERALVEQERLGTNMRTKWIVRALLSALLLIPSIASAIGGLTREAGAVNESVTESVFTSSGTLDLPSSVTTIYVSGCGGGGGGAGGHTADPGGGGGGGGSAVCVSEMPVMVTPGAALTVTIGNGGSGGAAGANGSPGSDTTIAGTAIGTVVLSGTLFNPTFGTAANGGNGGRNHMLTSSAAGGSGAGASGLTGANRPMGGASLWSIGGSAGGGATGPGAGGSSVPNGNLTSASGISGGAASGTKGGGGAGGSSPFGLGGAGGSNAVGSAATGYGAGGGGGAPTFAGGAGSPGFARIRY